MDDNINNLIAGKALDRYFDLNQTLLEFSELFNFAEQNERAIAILGGSFLEMILEHIILAYLPEEDKEVQKLMDVNQPLGNFSNKISFCYCLGLIEKVVKDDLNLIRKIRNKFAHDLFVSFQDEQIKSWCKELKWHKIAYMENPPSEATHRDLFQVNVLQLISNLNGHVSIARGQKRIILNNFGK